MKYFLIAVGIPVAICALFGLAGIAGLHALWFWLASTMAALGSGWAFGWQQGKRGLGIVSKHPTV